MRASSFQPALGLQQNITISLTDLFTGARICKQAAPAAFRSTEKLADQSGV